MRTLFLVLGIAFVLSLIPLAYTIARGYRRSRGARVVTCPETGTVVGVELNARKAGFTGAFGKPALRLSSCSRWPERQDCGQECLSQIEEAPDGCLVREKLAAWYADARCALCGRSIGQIRWIDHKPGFLTPDQKTIDWTEIAPEELPLVFETHKPVCWDCHTAESFLRRYPDRVVRDPRPPASRESGSGTSAAR